MFLFLDILELYNRLNDKHFCIVDGHVQARDSNNVVILSLQQNAWLKLWNYMDGVITS